MAAPEAQQAQKRRRRKTSSQVEQQSTNSVGEQPNQNDDVRGAAEEGEQQQDSHKSPPDSVALAGRGSAQTPRKSQAALIREAAFPLHTNVDSLMDDTVYLQTENGFKPVARDEIQFKVDTLKRQQKALSSAAAGDGVNAVATSFPARNSGSSTLTPAINCQSLIHTISLILQGFLSGACIVHCLFAWAFLPTKAADASAESLLSSYAHYALPVNAFYTGVLLLVTVGALDRTDPLHAPVQFVQRAVTLQSAGLCVPLGLVAIAANCAAYAIDHKLNLYADGMNAGGAIAGDLDYGLLNYRDDAIPLTPDTNSVAFAETDWLLYKISASVRALAALLGWLLVALAPGADALTDNMIQLQQNFDAEMARKPAAGEVS